MKKQKAQKFRCERCGEIHDGLPALGFETPFHYAILNDQDKRRLLKFRVIFALEKTYFGTICNEILDYKESTLGLHVNVNTRNGGIRPEIIPHQREHQLVVDWENGISIKEAKKRINRAMKNIN